MVLRGEMVRRMYHPEKEAGAVHQRPRPQRALIQKIVGEGGAVTGVHRVMKRRKLLLRKEGQSRNAHFTTSGVPMQKGRHASPHETKRKGRKARWRKGNSIIARQIDNTKPKRTLALHGLEHQTTALGMCPESSSRRASRASTKGASTWRFQFVYLIQTVC